MIVRYIHSTTSRSYDQNCDKWCDRKRWRRLLCKGKTNWSPKSTYYNVIGFIASWMDLFVLFIMLYTDWILKVRSVLKVIIAVLRRCTQHVALIAHMIIGKFFFFDIQYDRNFINVKNSVQIHNDPQWTVLGFKNKTDNSIAAIEPDTKYAAETEKNIGFLLQSHEALVLLQQSASDINNCFWLELDMLKVKPVACIPNQPHRSCPLLKFSLGKSRTH